MSTETPTEPDTRRAQLIEIAFSVIASVLTSAVVVSWTISATLSRLTEQVQSHERRMAIVESTAATQSPTLATIVARQNASDLSDRETSDRLTRIEEKVDRLLERKSR